MVDLDEIVEGFKLNLDRISPERLKEIVGLLDAVSRARLNQILDAVNLKRPHERICEKDFNLGVRTAISAIREELKQA